MSTHLLHEATELCDRVAIIDRGRLLAIDTPAGLERVVLEANRVAVSTGGDCAAVRAELERTPGVRRVSVVDDDANPARSSFLCEVEESDNVEAMIARAIASRWDLHRLERLRPSLERVFLHYVGQGREGTS